MPGARPPTQRERCDTVGPVRRPPGAWRLAAALVATAAASGCSLPNFGAPDPKSTEGESIFSLWQGFFVASIGVAALVWGLIIYSIVRFRRRGDDIPSQKPYNIPVEIVYTVAPVVAVALLFGFSVATEDTATRIVDDPAARIEVVGFQWSWQFVYPDEDVVVTGEPGEPPEMVIPLDRPTELELVSRDVAHAFWVPDFLSKRDLIPGVDNTITVTPTESGSYVGRCAEFCGLDHWRMFFSVRVVPEDEYEAWLDEQRAAAEADGEADADAVAGGSS
jgi:cytochrome c oxidase subunit II